MSQLITTYAATWKTSWERFWFTPSSASTLGLVRIFAGAMLFYTHLVWGLGLESWFGSAGQLPSDFVQQFHGNSPFLWSHLFWIEDSPALIWGIHILALVVLAMFCLGLWTRYSAVLAFLITVSYANRATGALFGLDQINAMLALYLAVGASGNSFSIDAWWRRRCGKPRPRDTVSTTVATRLIQLHMCVIYLFAGLGKLQGESWWNGEAIWGAAANQEYQTLNLLWLVHFPWLVNFLTHLTVAWEVSYTALVWPRLTRPIILLLAIPLHLGIAFAMGMITFGLVMLIGNLAFVPPSLPENLLARFSANQDAASDS